MTILKESQLNVLEVDIAVIANLLPPPQALVHIPQGFVHIEVGFRGVANVNKMWDSIKYVFDGHTF